MKVGIIARGLTKGGVTRYINNILESINKSAVSTEFEFIVLTDNIDLVSRYKNINCIYIKESNKLFWDCYLLLKRILQQKIDIVIYTKNVIPLTHFLFGFRKINVIHDLAHFEKELREYRFFDSLYMRTLMRFSCVKAQKTIAVSKFTKKDLIKKLRIPEENIIVIYEAVDESFHPRQSSEDKKILSRYHITEPYLFYCGSMSPRKNLLRVLKAFNEIKHRIPHNFYIASGQSWHDSEVREYIQDNLKDRVFLIGYIEDTDLPAVYSQADLYVYCSLYEGFGLPILEAQACGCVVLTSNSTSCPEIAGQGALIADAYNTGDISEKILCAQNQNTRQNLINKGFQNVRRFNWSNSTQDLFNTINTL